MITRWSSLVIDELCELKREGCTFAEAWDRAVRKHRPSLRLQAHELDTLFDEDGAVPDAEPMADFLRRVAEDAWHHRRPALRDLPELVDGLVDDTSVFAVPGRPLGPVRPGGRVLG